MVRSGLEAAAAQTELTAKAMLRVLGAIVFVVLAYTVLMMAAFDQPSLGPAIGD